MTTISNKLILAKPSFILFVVLTAFLSSCQFEEVKNQESSTYSILPVNKNASQETKALYHQLNMLSKDYVLVGHQDDLAYGVNWWDEQGRSDVKDITGSYPAIGGWDIGGIGRGWPMNLDSIPFDKMRNYIQQAYEHGSINTISWHTYNPVTDDGSWTDKTIANPTLSQILPGGEFHNNYVEMLDLAADFIQSLKSKDGNLIPILFRPFHENNGSWFWWGEIHCSPEQYKELYQFTMKYLIETRKLNNLLFVYSPDRAFTNEKEYLDRYPGDDFVDVIGYDDYYSFKIGDTLGLLQRLEVISDFAEKRNKIAAFTETGIEGLKGDKIFTEVFLPILQHNEKTKKMAYIMFWRNANTHHFYVPYLGQEEAEDFKAFRNHESILFGDDLPKMYQ
ncbi:glycoside hydrolase family 26 protein [Lentimicrobium sp. S6]|uniref:glycoside hydrolase family 26 protein n=1 Tax=Lentimicrobium sp. S6 TaxID=2735872 RepID=UPI0015536583|nr:glycosyl hydrolase [Lentimicrobium sp. S6]NPD45740.1 beta-mannosidase [Lentimicrobium sp. S6]